MTPRELILYCENKTVEVVITWAERQVKDSRRSGMVHRKLIDLANYVPSSSPRVGLCFTHRFFWIFEKFRPRRGVFFWLLLRRMKACIDEFQPNTSQANYFEGFWRITSKTNKKIEVRKQFECCVPIADSSESAAHVVQTQWIPSRLAFASLFAINSLLILMNYISEFMFACF